MQSKLKKQEYFNDFIISRSNRVAFKRCFGMATKPHNKGSILFVQGNSPCGKTHLLNTTAKSYKEKFNSNATVVTFSHMIDDYIKAVRNKNIKAFYDKYESNKLLLVDDIQCVTDMTSTQEEFVRIFSKFVDDGINIILFSGCKLSCYDGLKNGLYGKSYFSVVDIYKADLMLRKKTVDRCFI